MAILKSKIDPKGDEYQENQRTISALCDDLLEKRATVGQGGSERAREKHLERGKLLPRERVTRLLDPGTPFLEIGAMAAWDMYGGDIHAAGVIAGIGPY